MIWCISILDGEAVYIIITNICLTECITLKMSLKLALVVKSDDDTKQTTLESTGLATYSNSESTVLSYSAIFEISWLRALNEVEE
jgi:hypothetical protein